MPATIADFADSTKVPAYWPAIASRILTSQDGHSKDPWEVSRPIRAKDRHQLWRHLHPHSRSFEGKIPFASTWEWSSTFPTAFQ